jgi:hypothetical protein
VAVRQARRAALHALVVHDGDPDRADGGDHLRLAAVVAEIAGDDEAKLSEGDRAWEGSVERGREPMDENWIRGDAEQGERITCREALVVKAQAARGIKGLS